MRIGEVLAMAEYIEREAALEIINSLNIASALYAGRKIINLPPADVAPIRHGRWVTTSVEVFPGSSQFLCYSHKHDECGFQYVNLNGNEYDYCPKCGAKMDGGVDDACL